MACTTKEVTKGTQIILRNGFRAEVMDNLTNRATRMCKVFGLYEEMGSVYTSDIVEALMPDGTWQMVQHTPKVLATANARASWGF